MTNLNDQQFAKYSAIETDDFEKVSLPASMERHAPGEYQPTLPGMEHMLKGEQTHTSVLFPKPKAEMDEWENVSGSKWNPKRNPGGRESVDPRALHPTQDWMEDKNLHDPYPREANRWAPRDWGRRPLTEQIGNQRVIHDGHHRAARAIMNGAKKIETMRWDA
jgi:hypothetical protein